MTKAAKAKNAALGILLAVLMGNLIRTGGLNDVRTVDFLQIFASGVCAGIIIANLFSKPAA